MLYDNKKKDIKYRWAAENKKGQIREKMPTIDTIIYSSYNCTSAELKTQEKRHHPCRIMEKENKTTPDAILFLGKYKNFKNEFMEIKNKVIFL